MLDKAEEQQLRDIIARQQIHDLHCDYMRAQDRLIPELHRSVFFDDATTDYGDAYRGGPDGFVAFAQGVLRPHLANHHMIGQAKIEVEGDVAFGEVYFQAHHRIVENGEEEDLFVAGRYVDRYEKRAGTWKIAHRSELVDWIRREPRADAGLQGEHRFPWGSRAPDDLSCQREKLRRL
ncbi:MAG TPA: nuclear transport factor 2 family protein [Rhizomicrobium sp.]|nr:nuclear transport factor 2 family protein [Rhizomicrobium sp.]